MKTISINCPHCNHHMEYWTINDAISCTICGKRIPVEPCEEMLDLELAEEGEEDESGI